MPQDLAAINAAHAEQLRRRTQRIARRTRAVSIEFGAHCLSLGNDRKISRDLIQRSRLLPKAYRPTGLNEETVSERYKLDEPEVTEIEILAPMMIGPKGERLEHPDDSALELRKERVERWWKTRWTPAWELELEDALLDLNSVMTAIENDEPDHIYKPAVELMRTHRVLYECMHAGSLTKDIEQLALKLVDMSVDEIDSLAKTQANMGSDWYALLKGYGVDDRARMLLLDQEIMSPESDLEHRKLASKSVRRRRLKKLAIETEAWLDWIFGKTGEHRYWASWEAIERRKKAMTAQREFLDSHFMEDENGNVRGLAELHDSTLINKRKQTYAIALGMQEVMEEEGLDLVMYTVTNPGRFSPASKHYNGCSPVHANQELGHTLSLIRKQLNDTDGIEVAYGVHKKEGQTTGGVHAHGLCFTDNAEEVRRIVLEHLEVPCGSCKQTNIVKHVINATIREEQVQKTYRGKTKTQTNRFVTGTCPTCMCAIEDVYCEHQLDVLTWKPAERDEDTASVANYVFKYLDAGEDSTDDTPEASEKAAAYQAWRAGAACRTTAFFGLGRGFRSRWEAIYRSDVTMRDMKPIADETFQAAYEAKEAAAWGDLLRIIADLPRGRWQHGKRVGRVIKNEKHDASVWESVHKETETVFGEIRKTRTHFTMGNGEHLPLKTGEWTMHSLAPVVLEKQEEEGNLPTWQVELGISRMETVEQIDPETGEITVIRVKAWPGPREEKRVGEGASSVIERFSRGEGAARPAAVRAADASLRSASSAPPPAAELTDDGVGKAGKMIDGWEGVQERLTGVRVDA